MTEVNDKMGSCNRLDLPTCRLLVIVICEREKIDIHFKPITLQYKSGQKHDHR